jgi:hypothetical protein
MNRANTSENFGAEFHAKSVIEDHVHLYLRQSHRLRMSLKEHFIKYKKPLVITVSITILQLVFGFDPKFTIINIIWLLV